MPITIKDVRFSYCNLFQPKRPFNDPNGEPKYSVTILIPKSNTAALEAINQEINQAIGAGVASKWNGVRPPQPAVPIHDGDGPRPTDGAAYGPECAGCWVISASTKDKPFVVDAQVQEIIDPTQVYSGMWGNVSLSFYAYNNTRKGIGCSLNGVQKIRDDEALGSVRVTAQEAFQPVEPVAAPNYGAAMPAAYQPGAGYAYPQAAPQPGVGFAYSQRPQANSAPAGAAYAPTGMNIFGLDG